MKPYREEEFVRRGLETGFREEFYTVSRRRVLRGLHFQIPPHDHAKLVYCVQGRVFDVIMDLREGSPTFGEALSLELSAERANVLYLPKGIAHGFYVESDEAVLVYKTSSTHSPAHDRGVLWSAVPGIAWPDPAPILSDRDAALPSFAGFRTPFRYSPPARRADAA